jgi:DNA-binding Lrp family transcriptional regulator
MAGMTYAIVLIRAERSALATLGSELADVDGIAQVYSITGDWDFVAIIRLRDADQLQQVMTGKVAALEGITKTHTMVAFEAYSRHDMEAFFSLGQ